jgi:hypothetical protein
VHGGEGGIRTHVGALGPQVDFESTPLQPLRYLSDPTTFSPPRTLSAQRKINSSKTLFYSVSILGALCGLWG